MADNQTTKEQEYWSAFAEGYAAFRSGAVCPYHYQSADAWRWREGHREAEQRALEKQNGI